MQQAKTRRPGRLRAAGTALVLGVTAAFWVGSASGVAAQQEFAATPAVAEAVQTPAAVATAKAPGAPLGANVTAGFNPGKIISDENFYNGDGMTAAEVQQFLNSRMPRCTIGNPGRLPGQPIYGSTIAEACLKDYSMVTRTMPATPYCDAYVSGGRESAAEIIAKVGKACGINPKVLLVMLEKEQSLVGDSWPTVRQYNAAMGYACPDTGPGNSANCDAAYFGFFNQVYRASHQLKRYRAHPALWSYRAGRVNTVQWHPRRACGTSSFYIHNDATAALYIYTPYRPNAAALAAGWGTGDACSSYGNRNFYNYYKTWFGDPLSQPAQPAPPEPAITAGDIIARDSAGNLWNYGNLVRGYQERRLIGTGWGAFKTITAVDFSGDGNFDLVGNTPDGKLYMYAGYPTGGFTQPFTIGFSGWDQADVHVVRFHKHDRLPGLLVRFPNGDMYRYASGNGISLGSASRVGTHWHSFAAIHTGYFDGDNAIDVLAQTTAGAQLLYRTSGTAFVNESRRAVGNGWQGFVAASAAHQQQTGSTGLIAKDQAGRLYHYAFTGTGAGAFGASRLLGQGWQDFYLVRG